MKTKEEILDKYDSHNEYPSYYYDGNVILAMEEYAQQELKKSKQLQELASIDGKIEILTVTLESFNFASNLERKVYKKMLHQQEEKRDNLLAKINAE